MTLNKLSWCLLISFFCFSSCSKENEIADLIVMNGVIWTGEQEQTSADAMVIGGDKILYVGTN